LLSHKTVVLKKAVVGDPATSKAIGVALTSGNAGNPVQVVVDGEVHYIYWTYSW